MQIKSQPLPTTEPLRTLTLVFGPDKAQRVMALSVGIQSTNEAERLGSMTALAGILNKTRFDCLAKVQTLHQEMSN